MRECGTPRPGETIEAMLERMQADGSIGVEDGDVVAEFAEFLQDMGPAGPDGDRSRQRKALIKHADLCGLLASDVATLQAAEELSNPKVGSVCPECAAGKCGICAHEALDEANDLIVACACDHTGGAS